jgi:ABC-2 type transport system ATP-binding protein
LGDVLERATGRLSAGQKTRVSVAKAPINDPEVLLLDKPTASLDPDRAEWVRDFLRAYQRRRGTTILLSSHNMLEVERLCDFVVIMNYW